MFHISIIGTGKTGAALAYRLIHEPYVDRIDLVDIIPGLANMIKEDLNHAIASTGRNIEVRAYEKSEYVENADLIVITAGVPRKPGISRRDLAEKNFRIVKGIVDELKKRNENAYYLIVTNPVDAIATLVSDLVGGDRVFGTGTILETYRLRSILARSLNVAPYEVEGFVGGEHGEDAVILWSTVRIRGRPIDEYVEEKGLSFDYESIRQYVVGISIKIVEKQGATIWGPAEAFTRIILGVLLNTNELLSFSFLHDICGLERGIHFTVPMIISRRPSKTIWSSLLPREQEALCKAATSILDVYRKGLTALNNL